MFTLGSRVWLRIDACDLAKTLETEALIVRIAKCYAPMSIISCRGFISCLFAMAFSAGLLLFLKDTRESSATLRIPGGYSSISGTISFPTRPTMPEARRITEMEVKTSATGLQDRPGTKSRGYSNLADMMCSQLRRFFRRGD